MRKQIILIHILLVSLVSFAQIPNNGFENWTSVGSYSNPVGWGCLNNRTASSSVFTCEKGTPGEPGNSYLKLVSQSVSGIVLPGVACSGVLDSITLQPKSGFAYNQRSQSLTGVCQYMTQSATGELPSSAGYINILLTKWDTIHQTRDTISYTHYQLQYMDMVWTNFTINLNYKNGAAYPDSAIILLSSDGYNGVKLVSNNYLYIDNLAFSGEVLGITQYTDSKIISCYPNPASDKLTINLSSLKNTDVSSVKIIDVLGNQLFTMGTNITEQLSMDISSFANGVYYIIIQTKEGNTYTKPIIKQ